MSDSTCAIEPSAPVLYPPHWAKQEEAPMPKMRRAKTMLAPNDDDVPLEMLPLAAPVNMDTALAGLAMPGLRPGSVGGARRPFTPREMGRDRALAWAQTGWNANQQRHKGGGGGPVRAPFFASGGVVMPLPPVDAAGASPRLGSKVHGMAAKAHAKTAARQKAAADGKDSAISPPSLPDAVKSGGSFKLQPGKKMVASFLPAWAEKPKLAAGVQVAKDSRVDDRPSFRIQMKRCMEFVKIMNFVLKTRNFVFKTWNCVSKSRSFVLKMMNFAGSNLDPRRCRS